MDTIKRILGEAEGEETRPEENEPVDQPEVREPESEETAPDSATHEVANLWKTGNREDVALRFMEMSNKEAVKLVFAIGEEGALELAQMVDDMMERTPEEDWNPEDDVDSAEPARVEPPNQDADLDYVSGITGELKPEAE